MSIRLGGRKKLGYTVGIAQFLWAGDKVISARTVETGGQPSLRPQLLRTLGKGGAYYLLRFGNHLIHVLITLERFRVNLVDIFGT